MSQSASSSPLSSFLPKKVAPGVSGIFFKSMPTFFVLDLHYPEVAIHIQAFFKDNPETNKLPISMLNTYYMTDHITVGKHMPIVIEAIALNQYLQDIIEKVSVEKTISGIVYKNNWLKFCQNLNPVDYFFGEMCPGCESKDFYCFCGSTPTLRYSKAMRDVNEEFWKNNPKYDPYLKQKSNIVKNKVLDTVSKDTSIDTETTVHTENIQNLDSLLKESLISKLLKAKRNKA